MSKQVLVVEDDSDLRESVQELLEDEGYEVHLAKHGLDALHKLPTLPHLCLIVVDLLMPVMDGVEFIRRLRTGAHQPNVPVLVMSGKPTSEVPLDAPMLRKPVGLGEFLQFVKHTCPR